MCDLSDSIITQNDKIATLIFADFTNCRKTTTVNRNDRADYTVGAVESVDVQVCCGSARPLQVAFWHDIIRKNAGGKWNGW